MTSRLHTLAVGPFGVNCYLLWHEASSEGVIMDPGAEAAEIVAAVENYGITPKAILLTHGHGDHIAALAEVKDQFGLPVYIGTGDEGLLADPSANVSAFFDQPIVAPEPDFLVKDEEVLQLAGLRLLVLAVPGHTVGGVCYLEEATGRLFCGDTLFAGSIGRTDLPGGNYEQLLESIHTKILALPDSVVVLPGHGPRSTVGTERTSNPFLTGSSYA